MSQSIPFTEFPKMARLSRRVIISEKLDGTNAAVHIVDGFSNVAASGAVAKVGNLDVFAQSRTRFITPIDDNFGFARWVADNAEELAAGLGVGLHFGEYWGSGIQRRYGLTEKRFSLFNTERWGEVRPACCHVVPVLRDCEFSSAAIESAIYQLRTQGSAAAPGFMNPEGVVIWHTAARIGFKKTLDKDEMSKYEAQRVRPEPASAACDSEGGEIA